MAPLESVSASVEPRASLRNAIAPLVSVRVKYSSISSPVSSSAVGWRIVPVQLLHRVEPVVEKLGGNVVHVPRHATPERIVHETRVHRTADRRPRRVGCG